MQGAHRRCRRRGDTGAAAVEFALVSVLLLTLLFGIVQYGFYLYQSQSATSSAREGARLAAVGITACSQFKSDLDSRTTGVNLKNYRVSYSPGATVGSSVTVTVIYAPTTFGFPFVPFLTGDATQSGTARVERVFTGAAVSCP